MKILVKVNNYKNIYDNDAIGDNNNNEKKKLTTLLIQVVRAVTEGLFVDIDIVVEG